MKKITLSLLIIFISCQISFSQKRINEVEKLAITAKVWGFLKYYHPQVASGKFDWDQQLIDLLPKIKSAKSREELSQVYLSWLNQLGKVKICKPCQKKTKNEYFNKNFDLSWIENKKLFSEELSNRLRHIENNRLLKKHYYVKYGLLGEANPINENPFNDIGFPDVYHRLLGLFRYWNFIEYFYPNKYLTDQKWNAVLLEMIPKFLKVKREDDYFLLIKELVAKLDDSHAHVISKNNKGLNIFPYKVKNLDNNCVISGFHNEEIANQEGLLIGDIIFRVNNKDFNEEVKKSFKINSGSNLNSKLIYTYNYIITSENYFADLVVLRGGDTIKKSVKLYDYKSLYLKFRPILKWKVIDGNIGYVNMMMLENEDILEMMNALKLSKGIIFDLRGYPKKTFLNLSRYLNLERKPFAKFTIPDISYPGKFSWKKAVNTFGKKNKDYYKGKVIILADNQSLSLSEYAVMCLQTIDRAVTIGSQTAGADGKNIGFEYLGGYRTSMTSQGVFYPDGNQTQRIGIKIDIEVKPTIKGLIDGRDEVLEKAIEIINSKTTKN